MRIIGSCWTRLEGDERLSASQEGGRVKESQASFRGADRLDCVGALIFFDFVIFIPRPSP